MLFFQFRIKKKKDKPKQKIQPGLGPYQLQHPACVPASSQGATPCLSCPTASTSHHISQQQSAIS